MHCTNINAKIVSLSGAFSHYLYYTNSLDSKQVKAVETFSGLSDFIESGIEKISGGILTSSQQLSSYVDDYIVHDQSIQLEKILRNHPQQLKMEVKSIGLTPIEVVKSMETNLSFLLCKKQSSILKDFSFTTIDNGNIKSIKYDAFLVFVGKIQNKNKLPSLLMVNDGPALYLKKNLNLKTYESKLQYVNWSDRLLKKFMNNQQEKLLVIALEQTAQLKSSSPYKVKIEKVPHLTNTYNLSSSSLLIPGIGQLFALESIIKLLRT